MTSPQEQFTELTRRTQEGFRNLWQQWSEKGTELMKGTTSRSHPTATASTAVKSRYVGERWGTEVYCSWKVRLA